MPTYLRLVIDSQANVRVHCDATPLDGLHLAAVAACASDWRHSAVIPIGDHPHGSMEAEIRSLIHAAREAEKRALARVTFWCDNKPVVLIFTGKRRYKEKLECADLFAELAEICERQPGFKVKWKPRRKVAPAHRLAAWRKRRWLVQRGLRVPQPLRPDSRQLRGSQGRETAPELRR